MDFPTLLVLLTFITGILWLLDKYLWSKPREKRAAKLALEGCSAEEVHNAAKANVIVETARSLFPVILAVLVLRSFLAEPFRIPSGSMMPTLLSGDFILVNKFAYGLRLPAFNTKVVEINDPKRGDVIVFRYPENPRIDYIKRVVGVPGDRVTYLNKVLYINGKEALQTQLGEYIATGASATMNGASLRHEILPDDVEHDILVSPMGITRDFEFVVPEHNYFVLGDNRDNSRDSRYWGFVPDENLIGKAFMIWMNWDPVDGGIAWERIGHTIK